MDSMKTCLMNEWNISNSYDDKYRLLLQLPRDDMIGFRVMSTLLYSWDAIKVRYDSYHKSWQYILRHNNSSNQAIDKIAQSIHQENIIRCLCNEMSIQNWNLTETLDKVEGYLIEQSRVKFPEKSDQTIGYFTIIMIYFHPSLMYFRMLMFHGI